MKLKLLFASMLFAANAQAVNMAYVEVNSNYFANARCFINSNKQSFFGMASIFAANINGKNPNQPEIYLNPQVTQTLNSSQIDEMHAQGIKVLLTILGNHQNAGWACTTDEKAALNFADDVANLVEQYHLDGIDIDDEYSKCATNSTSLIMMAKAIKSHPKFKGKLLTKALFNDIQYFNASYQGHHLSDYLDYGFEMTYFSGDFNNRLAPYQQAGMSMKQLMIGGNANSMSPDPYKMGEFSRAKQSAGVMVYDIKKEMIKQYIPQLQKGLTDGQSTVSVIEGCLVSS